MINIQAPNAIWENWVVTEQLGRDSIGPVYRAQTMDGMAVASVKHVMVQMQGPQDAEAYEQRRERLSDAIGSMLQLTGMPGIVPVEDSHFEFSPDGAAFEAFIRTPSYQNLTEYLSGMGQPSRELVLRLGIDLAGAIDVLQENGLVHRNLKPTAIYSDGNGGFCLGNLWQVCRMDDPTITATTGTPNFMAPEVYQGKAVMSPTMDLYALGIVLYRLVNGNRVPFLTGTMTPDQALNIRMTGAAIPAPAYADEGLAAVLLKCLSPDPAQRYQRGADLAAALNALLNPAPAYDREIEADDPTPAELPVTPAESAVPETPAAPKGFRQFRMTKR